MKDKTFLMKIHMYCQKLHGLKIYLKVIWTGFLLSDRRLNHNTEGVVL